jgi:hypothetical protein
VTVPPGESNVAFTHVENDLIVPFPSRSDLDAYVVYIGFDALAQPERKKPAAKPRRH